MHESVKHRNELLSKKVIKNLENRKFEAYYCSTKEDALEQVISLIPKDHVVSWGGSESLKEIGVFTRLSEHEYQVIDRDTATTVEERFDLMRQAFFCDTYLMGTNALSEDGILFNVDGNGNRVAALTFGPKSVIIVVGMNKVVKSREDAYVRARTVASPINTQRYSVNVSDEEKMPCLWNGSCGNCQSARSICSTVAETRMCNEPKRIKVILVGEELGF